MDVHFQRNFCPCQSMVLHETQNAEQTQEIRLTEGMPDVGRILSAWGQPILRGKEWGSDSLSFTGGMMVWVLYVPEDGSPEQCLEGWIPFQMRWDLPEDVPEGRMQLRLIPRMVDARSVSPRKILVRAGMGAMVQAFVPAEIPLSVPDSVPEDVELLKSTYPVRLLKETGEKAFTVDEELTLPDSAPQPEQIIYYRADPRITDRKVLSEKVVFRGNTCLHILYRGEDGQLHSWDFDLPFSQVAELSGEYGPEAQAEFALCPTSMELELEEGRLELKCGMAAQYGITDREQLELVEDAYSPGREITVQTEPIQIPAELDKRRETLYAEQTIPAQAVSAVDMGFLPDYPRQRFRDGAVVLEQPGTFQVLYNGEDGALHAGTARWDGELSMKADDNAQLSAVPAPAAPSATLTGSQLTVKAELPIEITARANQRIPMVTGLTLGQTRKPDPARPSLILRRAGEDSLWQIAKASNSTVASIREANALEGEPAPGQLLLIPIA